MMRFFTKFLFLFFIAFLAGTQGRAQSVGGTTSGSATYCSSTNSGFISVTGFTGSILEWESSTDGGSTWTSIPNTTPSQSYFNLIQSTCYRAVVQSGAFPPDTSTFACVTVYAPSAGGVIVGAGTFCGNSGSGTLNLSGNTGNPLYWEFSTDSGATWTTLADTTTFLNYTGITQNTIYQTVVQNGPACPSDTSSQVSFVINPVSVAGTLSGSDTVCFGANTGTVYLSGNAGTITGWQSSVNNGLTWTPITNLIALQTYSNLTQTTLYEAIVQNGSCPADTSAPLSITVFAPFPVNAGNDTSILSGQSLTLNGSGTGLPLWLPNTGLSSDTIFHPSLTPPNTITYQLTVTDTNGCTNSDFVVITVTLPEFTGMVSNLFTPNGDGINDTWYIENIQNFPGNEVFVYNIYGNKVFEKKEYTNDWQGTYNGADLPDGTYYYVLKFDDSSKVIKGSLDILRNK